MDHQSAISPEEIKDYMYFFKDKKLSAIQILKENRDKIDKGCCKGAFGEFGMQDSSVFGLVEMEVGDTLAVIMFGYSKPLGKYIGHYDGEYVHGLLEFESH